jgi:hypothetical protein
MIRMGQGAMRSQRDLVAVIVAGMLIFSSSTVLVSGIELPTRSLVGYWKGNRELVAPVSRSTLQHRNRQREEVEACPFAGIIQIKFNGNFSERVMPKQSSNTRHAPYL